MCATTSSSLAVLMNSCDPKIIQETIERFWGETTFQRIHGELKNAGRFSLPHLHAWAEQVLLVASNSGQTALATLRRKLPQDIREEFNQLNNQYDRSVWLYAFSPELFQFVVQRLVTDDCRSELPHSTFSVAADSKVDFYQQDAFRSAVADHLSIPLRDVAIQSSIYRSDETGEEVFEFTLFCNRLAVDVAHVMDGQLLEAREQRATQWMVTYSPQSGDVDVYAKDFQWRKALAEYFCVHMLGRRNSTEKLFAKEYEVESLVDQRFLEIEDEDLTWVKVTELSANIRGRRMAFEVSANDNVHIKEAMSEILGPQFDLSRCSIESASVLVRLGANEVMPEREVKISFKSRHSCAMKVKHPHDRMFCHRLLKKWGIVKEKAYGIVA